MPFSIKRSREGKSPDIKKWEREKEREREWERKNKLLLNVATVSQVETVNVSKMTERVRLELNGTARRAGSGTSDRRQGDKELDGRRTVGVRTRTAANERSPVERAIHQRLLSLRQLLRRSAHLSVHSLGNKEALNRRGWSRWELWSLARSLRSNVQRKRCSASSCSCQMRPSEEWVLAPHLVS